MNIQPVILIVTAISILSCSQKKNGYEVDCNYQKRQAQNDFNYKNYTWTIFSGLGYDYLDEEEFTILLSQNHIKNKKISRTCLISPNDKYENCGEMEMNRLIEKEFGNSFIDSLHYIAKQNFVKKNPEEVFSYEQCDQNSRYPHSTMDNQFDKMRSDYLSKYPTPPKYIRKNETYYSYTSAMFILTKDGKVKDLSVESSLQNKKNNIFEKQFNKQLKDFVLHTQWIPAKISGLNVDSYYDVTIHYN
nr:hypothetical protein [uncultured Chryseobacterium sp.]